MIQEALAIFRVKMPGQWWIEYAESVRGACLTGLGRYAEAEPLLLGAYPVLQKNPDAAVRRDALGRIVELYQAWGKPDKAADFRALSPKGEAP